MKKIILISLFLGACAGFGDKVDPKIKSIKKIAIVGYTFDQARANNSSNIVGRLLSANDDNEGMGSLGNPNATVFLESKHVDMAYTGISKILSEKFGYKLASRSKVRKNKIVRKIIEDSKSGIQVGVFPLAKNSERYSAYKLPQTYQIKSLSEEKKAELQKSLGVDAIAFVYTSIHLSRTSIMGLGVGDMSSKSGISLQIYSGNDNDYLLTLNASGEEVSGVDASILNFADSNKMDGQALKAVHSAEAVLIEKFNKAL